MHYVHISRLPHFDYTSDGYYFVTIISRLRLPIFDGFEDVVHKIFYSIVQSHQGVRIDTMVVMPNHVHCVLKLSGSTLSVGEIIRQMKAKVSYVLGQSCWQSNYYEHVIRSDESLGDIREYIKQNPEQEAIADKSARHKEKIDQKRK